MSGLGCNGLIEVLFNPINRNHQSNECALLKKAIQADQECVMLKSLSESENSFGAVKLFLKGESNPEFLHFDSVQITEILIHSFTKVKPTLHELKDKNGVQT